MAPSQLVIVWAMTIGNCRRYHTLHYPKWLLRCWGQSKRAMAVAYNKRQFGTVSQKQWCRIRMATLRLIQIIFQILAQTISFIPMPGHRIYIGWLYSRHGSHFRQRLYTFRHSKLDGNKVGGIEWFNHRSRVVLSRFRFEWCKYQLIFHTQPALLTLAGAVQDQPWSLQITQ